MTTYKDIPMTTDLVAALEHISAFHTSTCGYMLLFIDKCVILRPYSWYGKEEDRASYGNGGILNGRTSSQDATVEAGKCNEVAASRQAPWLQGWSGVAYQQRRVCTVYEDSEKRLPRVELGKLTLSVVPQSPVVSQAPSDCVYQHYLVAYYSIGNGWLERALLQMDAIYRLGDPRDGLTRYIGRTCHDIEFRLYFHLRYPGTNPGKFAWLQDLKLEGLKPDREIIEECHYLDSPEREAYWIAYYILILDMPLLNRTKIKPKYLLQWANFGESGIWK